VMVRGFREDCGSVEKRKTGRIECDVTTVKYLDLVGEVLEVKQARRQEWMGHPLAAFTSLWDPPTQELGVPVDVQPPLTALKRV
jgi:hypothetical protein